MGNIINTNIESLNAQNNLGRSQAAAASAIQRLSSGLRINSAKDDAAGLAISERMTTQIRGNNQAARNANDAISLAQTAEGALSAIGGNLQRIRELAVQSANATNTSTDRNSLQTEVNQLLEEIDRVASQASFNGTKLLNGSFTSAVFQVGANANETITVSGIVNATQGALSSVSSASTQSAAISALPTPGTATAAGALTINGTSIEGLAAVGTTTERAAQIVDAINRVSTTTGVNAAIDTVSNVIALTSSADIVLAGTTPANLGFTAGTTTATTTTGLTLLSVSSFAGATLGIQQMDSALSQVNSARATLGALQNRFTSTVDNLNTMAENLTASRSRIQDADYAKETAALSRTQVLQQAGMAMVAQANAAPQGVLTLLRG